MKQRKAAKRKPATKRRKVTRIRASKTNQMASKKAINNLYSFYDLPRPFLRKQKPKISRARRNPFGRRQPHYLIEALVRKTPHDRKFEYWYWNGSTGFTKERTGAHSYPNKFTAESAARHVTNRGLPPRILQLRVTPA